MRPLQTAECSHSTVPVANELDHPAASQSPRTNELPMRDSVSVRVWRWKGVAGCAFLALACLVVWDGSLRRPADATQAMPQRSVPRAAFIAGSTLKLASFNIHGGKGQDGQRDLRRIAALLTSADFAGLYEVRAGSDSNQAQELGDLCDSNWLFAATETQWWTNHFGNGLVARSPYRPVLRIPLLNTRGKAFRNALVTSVPLQGKDVRIIAVHVDSKTDREQQLRTVIELFLSLQPPCVLMGDLNSPEDDPQLVELRTQTGVHSPLHESHPEIEQVHSIDWIFTRGLHTVSAELVPNSASDHPCLTAELELARDN